MALLKALTHRPFALLWSGQTLSRFGDSTSLLPIGFALAGWMTDALGAAAVFATGGLLMTALAMIGLATASIRKLD